MIKKPWPNDWPNRLASRGKLKTWVYLLVRLARPYLHFRWLSITCAHLGRNQICLQIDRPVTPFGHQTQLHASWVMSTRCYSNLLTNEIRGVWPSNGFFATSVYLRGNFRVRFPTHGYLRVFLARASGSKRTKIFQLQANLIKFCIFFAAHLFSFTDENNVKSK